MWQRVGGEVNGGNWVLEAGGTVSEDRTFALESARFNATSSSSLTLFYQMSGSGSVSLALESQMESGGWTTIFLRTGDKGASWHTSVVAVPDGTIALRLLANITAVEDIARVDSLWASHVVSSEASFVGKARTCHDGPSRLRVPSRFAHRSPIPDPLGTGFKLD